MIGGDRSAKTRMESWRRDELLVPIENNLGESISENNQINNNLYD